MEIAQTDRTRHRRLRAQGSLSRADLRAILVDGFICHLGVVIDGYPMVVPTVYGLNDAGNTVYFHGSAASRSLRAGATVCLTVTHLDGLVLSRSVFEHGVNYRSAMIYGVPRLITDPDEKLDGLRHLTEHIVPGQWDYARQPDRKELAATSLLALNTDESSVKIRQGPPEDGGGPDGSLDVWAGVRPIRTVFGELEPDPQLRSGVPVPAHLQA